MAYTPRLFDSMAAIDAIAWDSVWDADGRYLFMQRGFLRAAESSMQATTRLRYLLIDDESGRPVCAACLSTFTLYIPDMTAGVGRAVLAALPARLASVTLLFCGLPVSAGQRGIAFVPGCDAAAALRAVGQTMSAVATAEGATFVCFKEFDPDEELRLSALETLGYSRFATPSMHVFPHVFSAFDHYIGALRSSHRNMVRDSQRRFRNGGATYDTCDDPQAIEQIYTSEVHDQYLEMVGRSDTRVEILPREFFLQLSREVTGVRLLTARRAGRTIGFTLCAWDDRAYYCLFAGLDYAVNQELHLYFNLLYNMLADAFRMGASHVYVGQTADYFKARLGCVAVPRAAYARGRGPLTSWLFRNVLARMMPPAKTVPVFHPFRQAPGEQGAERAAVQP